MWFLEDADISTTPVARAGQARRAQEQPFNRKYKILDLEETMTIPQMTVHNPTGAAAGSARRNIIEVQSGRGDPPASGRAALAGWAHR
ncbi:MAG TPA: hypothetical protein VLN58_10960 [Verrucomicrobiae bacterium]|nr:hypothetical protein [Verrucomicrobiae bacterium]